jgi:electron transfer flavoprotein beta subunit
MKIIVCIKQVPDTVHVRINEKTGAMEREGVPAVVNPYDLYALEEALRLREAHGGSVAALTMGPPQAEAALRDAIALGVDEGYHLSGREFAGGDTLATSYALAKGVQKIGEYHLVLCGKQAIDGDTAQVGPELAEHLGLPFLGFVRRVREAGPGRIVVERMTEDGADVVESSLPAVLSVVKEINTPRLPSLKEDAREHFRRRPGRGRGNRRALGFAGSPTKVVKVFHPRPARREITRQPAAAAAWPKLRAWGSAVTTVRVSRAAPLRRCVSPARSGHRDARAAALITDACTACGICVTVCPSRRSR